jgi:methanol--5-hydroxybenzimidazolylcobamide Co-methyltransferase
MARNWDSILNTFEGCAKNGAEFLQSNLSVARKYMMMQFMFCDISKSIFAQLVLGCKDMGKIWTE